MSLMMQVVISQQPLKLADGMRQQELEFLEESLEILAKVCVGGIALGTAADP